MSGGIMSNSASMHSTNPTAGHTRPKTLPSGAEGTPHATGALLKHMTTANSPTADSAQYGSMVSTSSPNDIPDCAYRYRFCGLPIGVSMLPRFAASVCNMTSGTASRRLSESLSTTSANGTKVMSATSLVATMLKKKGRKTSTSIILRVLSALLSSLCARKENSPAD